MVFLRFYDRKKELQLLNHLLMKVKRYKKSLMIVVHGRRRVGKTRLLIEFLRQIDVPTFYFHVTRKDEHLLLTDLVNDFIDQLQDRGASINANNVELVKRSRDLPDFFKLLFQILPDESVVVFDEFQYLRVIDGGVLSTIQKIWDHLASQKSLLLILSGSQQGMIQNIFAAREPLFGRAHSFMKVRPFTFTTVYGILEDLGIQSLEEKVIIYSRLGGHPHAIELFSLHEDLDFLFFDKMSPLLNEVPYTLMLDFGNAHPKYFSILQAISEGKNRPTEIASLLGESSTSLQKYLYRLEQEFALISRQYPLLKERSKTARYFISDPLYKFWFQFVYKNMSRIEGGFTPRVAVEDLRRHESQVFENLALEFVPLLSRTKAIPFNVTKLGKWWFRDIEMDFIGLTESSDPPKVIFGECKWTNKPFSEKNFQNLVKKSEYFPWKKEQREDYFIVFSRSGFSIKSRDNAWFFDLKSLTEEMEKDRENHQP